MVRRRFNKPKAGKSLGDLYPELVDEWDYEKNENITPFDVGPSVNYRFHWVCKKNSEHKWDVEARDRTRGRGCPYCSKGGAFGRKRFTDSTSFQGEYPELASFWDYEKNGDTKPNDILPNSAELFYWKCPKGDDHKWRQKPNTLVSGFKIRKSEDVFGCPYCSGKKVSKTNSLLELYPDVASFWHPEKNDLNPNEVTANSDKMAWWLCPECKFEWETTPHAKSYRETGCPQCRLSQMSEKEVLLAYELKHFFEVKFGFNNIIKGKTKDWDVDIFIEKLGLVIEYDGAFFHKDKYEVDTRKTKDLQKNGYSVIRLRINEKRYRLEKITEDDIEIPSELSIKETTNILLEKIEEVCNLKIEGLEEYLKSNESVNKKSATQYISQLMKDKHQTTLM